MAWQATITTHADEEHSIDRMDSFRLHYGSGLTFSCRLADVGMQVLFDRPYGVLPENSHKMARIDWSSGIQILLDQLSNRLARTIGDATTATQPGQHVSRELRRS